MCRFSTDTFLSLLVRFVVWFVFATIHLPNGVTSNLGTKGGTCMSSDDCLYDLLPRRYQLTRDQSSRCFRSHFDRQFVIPPWVAVGDRRRTMISLENESQEIPRMGFWASQVLFQLRPDSCRANCDRSL